MANRLSIRTIEQYGISSSEETMLRIIIITTLALASLPALARDNGQWEHQSAAIRQWFQKLMKPDHPERSCCGEADAYEADTFEIMLGTKIPAPNHKMKMGRGNPTGHGIIFIGSAGQVFCYVTREGI
jgi:hypothetical protein